MIAQLATADVPATTNTVPEPEAELPETSEADVKTEVTEMDEIHVNEIEINEIEHINSEPAAKRKSPIKIITPVAPQLGKRVSLQARNSNHST